MPRSPTPTTSSTPSKRETGKRKAFGAVMVATAAAAPPCIITNNKQSKTYNYGLQ